MAARIDKLEHDLAVQQDIHQIRRIQYTYGYFIGKSGVRRLYIDRFQKQFTQGHNGPRYGWLLDHPQHQMVIDVAADRNSAKVRATIRTR